MGRVATKKDPIRDRVIQTGAQLPETQCDIQGDHAIFTVRKKTFAYYMNNHHGDGIKSIACKVLAGDNTALVAAQPDRFYLPAYIGSRGWVGLRLDVGEIDWDEVAEMMTHSYRMTAPKKLAAAAGIG